MGAAYLLDTNVISKYLNEDLSEWDLALLDEAVEEQPTRISVITRIELKVYRPALVAHEQQIQSFIDGSVIYDLIEPIIGQTIRLRRHYKSVKLPDAIIAATAMMNDFTLLSANDRDFEKIAGLKYKSLSR